jgi:hypothetical protein
MALSFIFSGLLYTAMIRMASAAPDDECASQPLTDYNMGLHIAAVFIILVASGLGAFIPVLAKVLPSFKVPGKIITLGMKL